MTHSQITFSYTVSWGISLDNIRVAGYPEGERRAAELLADSRNRDSIRITFISSMAPAIEKYINILADNLDMKKYEILFKLHPNEYTSWRELLIIMKTTSTIIWYPRILLLASIPLLCMRPLSIQPIFIS